MGHDGLGSTTTSLEVSLNFQRIFQKLPSKVSRDAFSSKQPRRQRPALTVAIEPLTLVAALSNLQGDDLARHGVASRDNARLDKPVTAAGSEPRLDTR